MRIVLVFLLVSVTLSSVHMHHTKIDRKIIKCTFLSPKPQQVMSTNAAAVVFTCLNLYLLGRVAALDNGLALTPPMVWYICDLSLAKSCK